MPFWKLLKKRRENKMLIVNFFGAPGAGKSTGAAYVFSRLKMAGVKCELATEYAKDAVWEDNQEVLQNQIKILGEQYFKITRCDGKVDVLITDSPLINCYYYNKDETLGDSFKDLVFSLFTRYENMNFYINRTKPYVQDGRLQTEIESNAVGIDIKNLLLKNNISFMEFDGDIKEYDRITDSILNVVKSRGLVKKEIAMYDPFTHNDKNKSADRDNKSNINSPRNCSATQTKPTKKKSNKVYIYTDGSCLGNPGPGGFGAVVVRDGIRAEFAGGESKTTNNRMEILAAITALEQLDKPCNVVLTTDSKYLCDAIMQGWIENWKRNGWITSAKTPVLNQDLWERLDNLLEKHNVLCEWVKGHNGHKYNERCDELAKTAAQKHNL